LVIPIIPKAPVPRRPPEHSCKNSSVNLDTNFGMIPFRLLTRENSQRYPAQNISRTTTSLPSRSKMVENLLLSTKESTPVYCKAAFLPIMLSKTILECKNPVRSTIFAEQTKCSNSMRPSCSHLWNLFKKNDYNFILIRLLRELLNSRVSAPPREP
jgi:hypothetical protein